MAKPHQVGQNFGAKNCLTGKGGYGEDTIYGLDKLYGSVRVKVCKYSNLSGLTSRQLGVLYRAIDLTWQHSREPQKETNLICHIRFYSSAILAVS